jgi:hypothetical protein
VVAGLVSALRSRRWTAVKITQYGHGICSADGAPCDCATADHSWAILEENDRSGESDSSRYLLAGAERSLWVRTRQGDLAQAMPELRRRLAAAENVILESNSVIRFLRPDLYLVVLDYATPDFKPAAREFLDRAHAVVLHQPVGTPQWSGISLKLIAGKPIFTIRPPQYVTPELAAFVQENLWPDR